MKYIDIAHGMSDGTLWIYYHGRILTAPTEKGTHSSVWGEELAGECWRGRYEPTTGRLSIIAPMTRLHNPGPPSALLDALEAYFGGDIEPVAFNPMGEAVEIG